MQDWWALLAWYENVFVWPLAIGALLLLLKAKSVRRRAISVLLLLLVFLPHIQKAVGDVYFDYLCRTQAGERIYGAVRDVQGIVQLRGRDYSKDYFDEARHGRFPEDPVGHIALGWGGQGGRAFVIKTGDRFHAIYEYFEEISVDQAENSSEGTVKYTRFSKFDPVSGDPLVRESGPSPISRYGYTYKSIAGPMMALLELKGGKTEIIAVQDGNLLAEFRGFVRTGRKYGICPLGSMGGERQVNLRTFVTSVLIPKSFVLESP